MNNQIKHLFASLGLAACLSAAAWAQPTQTYYDYTTGTEYRTSTDGFNWTPDVRTRFTTTIQNQNRDYYPIFTQERADLWPILTPQQQALFDRYQGPSTYYGIGLLNRDQYGMYQTNLARRLNLTPEQMTRYQEVQTRTYSQLEPISTRYSSQYSTYVPASDWSMYQTRVTSPYLMTSTASTTSNQSSAAQEEVVERRRYTETTTTTTVPTTPVRATVRTQQTSAPATQAQPTWRNRDMK